MDQETNPARGAGETAFAFPSDGGAMGALMRAKDWSATPLGPIGTWSLSLRMMVSFLLANRFPLLLWWGPQYVSIYNDAYRPVLGNKHPDALGQPARECWSEIWHILEPLIDSPFNGGPATWMDDLALELNRHDFVEETHFTVAYSPVPDETAPRGIGGVLATVHEITEKVIGERRVQVLRDLGVRVAEGRTAESACEIAAETLAECPKDIPFALIYLLDTDGRKARLAGVAGIGMGEPVSPVEIDLNGQAAGWPLEEAVRNETIVTVNDLGERFGRVPPGPWADLPRSAVVVPIRSNKAHRLAGLLVAGVSARLRLDDLYLSFFDLVASQIATAVANARSYEEERRRAEALAEIDRAKTLFFSNVSHEFRTPLTLMLGPIEELLNDPASLAEGQRRQLDVAHRNSLRLLRLVNTLLDFSRIEAGRAQANYRPTDLAALTTDLASGFRSATERAGLSLDVECPPLPEPVFVDRDMWEKIVLNLLSNAFKFTFEGGITVTLRADGDQVELRVRDTGVGIPQHELPRLFERFHRVEGSRGRTHEGTGIGLALVQELVRLHGGTVRVESEVGGGSTFIVTVPPGSAHLPPDRVQAESTLASTSLGSQPFVEEALRWLPDSASKQPITDVPRELPPTPSLPAEREGRAASILLADDNADMRDYVARLLAPHYDVRAVADGTQALAAMGERRPDLLLSDVMMPRLDGFALVRQVRADPALADMPIILLSARAGEEESIQGLEAGADDYLVKPFGARELLARTAAALKMARIRKEFEQRIATDLDDMTRLHEIGIQCARADGDLNTCLENILDAAIEITRADKGNVQLFDSDSGALRIAAHTNFEQPFLDFFAHVRREEAAACGAAMQAGGRVLVEDVTQSDIFAGQPSLHVLLAAGVRAVQATPLLSSSGAVLGMISTHFSDPHRPDARALRLMDLLARQAADYLERKQAESALQQAQAQLQAIFDDVPFGVYLVDSDLRIRSVNPTALPVFGDIPDLIGRDFTEVIHRLWPRAYAEEVVRRFRHTLGTGEPYYAPEVAEKRRDRGITEYYEWRINRVALPEGRNGVVCYFRDVSAQVLARHALADAGLDLKRLNAQLEARVNQEVAAREEAQAHLAHAQRMEALGQLAGGIAHDFNNVLQAVHGGASLIERRPGEPDSVSRLARLVVEAAGRGSAITRRLLAFSRRGDLRAEAVDPVSLLSDMREILVHTLGTGITVRVEADPALPPLWADKGQVETVLVNLAANARDAMAGKGVLTLRAAAETVKHGGGAVRPRSLRTGDYICLSVTDTGTGMPPEVLARVTEPFFTTKEQGKGTGLGLAMARGFAEQSDGGLHIESALGRGTTVTLSLPVAGGMEAAARPPEEEAVPDGKRHTRVLVVDDDPIVREIVTNQLEMAGYTVLSAPDGAAALALLDTGTKIDLLISDLSMPGMDGLSLLREGRRRRPKLAVILLTGFATNAAEIAIGGATGGGFTLLRKPVTAHQLAERVEMLLEGAAIAEGNATH